ncbi:hypothetical protein AB1Y20_018874 [Prymnesium parvum]|uniref:Neurotransmitter-gated ion-channel transmembrane domain-containing protein n=1 Tax=Prymnesium parvum TaxID=97485 RepID=A0AB34JSW1_PRYPA
MASVWFPSLAFAASPCGCHYSGWGAWLEVPSLIHALPPLCAQYLLASPCVALVWPSGVQFCQLALVAGPHNNTPALISTHSKWGVELARTGACNGTDWLSGEAGFLNTHISQMSKSAVAAFIFYFGVQTMQIDAEASPEAYSTLYKASINGQAFLSMDLAGWRTLGLDPGSTDRLVRSRDLFLASYFWPATDYINFSLQRVYDPTIPPMNISIAFVLQEVNSIDELDYSFEVTFLLALAWEDDRIFVDCNQAGIGGFSSLDNCRYLFQPEIIWPNVVLDPEANAVARPKLITDMGLTTSGKSASRAWEMRQKFQGNFQFEKFPYDSQNLSIIMRAPFHHPFHKVRFNSEADKKDPTPPQTWHPLFDVTNVITTDGDARIEGGNVGSQSFPDIVYASTTITIKITRVSIYFIYNFILIMSLLVMLALLTFLLSEENLEARLSLALTVVLGLNVYQIVVVSTMPATGYLTNMHSFTIYATALVCGVALENVCAHLAWKRATVVRQRITFLRPLKHNPDAHRAARNLQAAWRGHQQRIRLERAIDKVSSRHSVSGPAKKVVVRLLQKNKKSSVYAVDGHQAGPRTRSTTGVSPRNRIEGLPDDVKRKVRSLLRQQRRWDARIKYYCQRDVVDPLALFAAKYLDTLALIFFPACFALLTFLLFEGRLN